MSELKSTPYPAETMAKYDWLDECLQALPAVEKEFQPAWQAYKYMLRGKMFAYLGVHEPSGRPIITLKLNPLDSYALREDFVDIVPGYYMNKNHWSTIYLDGEVPQEIVMNTARASHNALVSTLSKMAQQEILG